MDLHALSLLTIAADPSKFGAHTLRRVRFVEVFVVLDGVVVQAPKIVYNEEVQPEVLV